MSTSNYLTINGEMFPYENARYNEVDSRITGKHFVMCLTPDVPMARLARIKAQGVIDIKDMAEAKVFELYPEDEETTSFGTYKHAYYVHLKEQLPKTLFWVMNKQPGSITFIANKIDGMSTKADEITDPNSLYGKIQLNMQNGVTTQIVIPDTGYSCIVPPVVNKKQMPIFTKHFICEKYIELYESKQLQDTEVIAHMRDVYAKYERLEDYRQTIQKNIWSMIHFTLVEDGFIEAWKKENLYTMQTRVAFAVQFQTADILDKYARDFNIPSMSRLTLDDLKDPKNYEEMLRVIANYGPKFGVSVKTTESQADTMTYMPAHWMRKKTPKDVIPESVVLKQIVKTQNALRRAPLNELLQAYIQIDWYMSQEDMENYLVDGYTLCNGPEESADFCNYILSRKDAYCPKCGTPNPDYEPDMLSYDEEQYMIGTWDTYKLD